MISNPPINVLSAMSQANANLAALAPKSILHFTMLTMPRYNIGWHHDKLANALHRVAAGKCKRLMVFMPPRHGKTELVSVRFPAWVMGRDPNKQIIGVSYGSQLANRNAKQIKKVINSKAYKSIFTNTKLSDKKIKDEDSGVNQANFFEIQGHRGYYRAAGMGGTITGTGGDIIIVDDIIKNRKEANSPVYRENVWNEYNDTIKTRLEGSSAALILVMTRWHEDDLAGRLLKAMRENPNAEQWEVVKLEAVREDMDNKLDPRQEGEALWPWKFDEKALLDMKANMPSSTWNALYQQRPSSLEGNIFKRINLKNFYKKEELPEHFEQIIQSWDATFSESEDADYVVGTVWGKHKNRFYLLDLVRRQMGYVDTMTAIRIMSAKWPKAWKKIIEKKANGAALIDSLSRELTGVTQYVPTESKVSRANSVSPFFAANNVWLPDPSIAPWIGDYIEELVTFPNAQNDDQVDSTTQALIDLGNNGNWLANMNN